MTDYNSPLDIPNQLGQDFVNSGIGGSGGGGLPYSTLTYALSPSGNQVVLTPNEGGGITQVDVSGLPAISILTTKTQNITYANTSTIISNNVAVPGNLILDNNVLTTTGSGNTAVLTLNGNNIGGTASTWANYPAINNVSIPSPYNLTINGDNVLSGGNLPVVQMNADLLLGTGSSHFPDFIAYPVNFQVGSILTPARTISMRSGVGGTTIGSVQGISLQAGIDINLNATGDINLLSVLTTIEGNAIVTGTLTTNGELTVVGNANVDGSSEVLGNFTVVGLTELGGATTISGETTITGQTNITGLTTINGGLVVSGVADLNGGVAIAGGMGVVGVATMNGNILQQTGNIQTSNITDYAGGGLQITPSGKLALTNLSSINGFPYTSGANQPWYNVPAGADVNMNNSSIYGVARLSGYADTNLRIDAYTSAGSTCGIVLDATTGGRIIMSGGAVEIDNILNVNGDVSIGSPGTHNTITADKGNFTALSSISSINGLPYATGNVAEWSLYPADHPVVINSEPINGVSALNVAVGQNFSINNAFTATYIQGNSLIELYTSPGGAIDLIPGIGGNVAIQNNCPLSVYAITGVSSINGAVYPPPNTGAWYTIPAQASPSLNNYSLANVGSVIGQIGGTLGINNNINGSVAIGNALVSSITTTASNVYTLGSNVNTISYSTLSLLSQSGSISLTAPQYVNITGNGGVNIQSDIGINVFGNLALKTSTITGISTINGLAYPPPPWYNITAGANVNMGNYNLTNANNVFSPGGDTSFVVGGGNLTSYIRFNDAGNTNYEVNQNLPTLYIKTTTSTEKDFTIIDTSLLFLSTAITTITGETYTSNLSVLGNLQVNGTTSIRSINTSSITYSGVAGATNITQTIGFPYKQQTPSGQSSPYSGGFLPYGATYQYDVVGTSFYTNGNTIFGIIPTPTFTNYGDGITAGLLPITFPDSYHFAITTLGMYEISIRFASLDISLPTTLYKNNGFYLDFGVDSSGTFTAVQSNLIMGMAYYAELSNDSVYITAPLTATFKVYFPLATGYCFRTRPLAYSQNAGTAQLGAGELTLTYLGQPTNL